MMTLVVLLLLIGGGVTIFVLRHSGGAAIMAVNARMGRYGLVGADGAQQIAVSASPQGAASRAVQRAVERGGWSAKIQDKLVRADLKITPTEFVSICLVIFVVALLVGVILKGYLGLLALGVAGVAGPWIYLARRISKRRKKFVEQLADMAQMMGNSMRAGFSIMQSMDLVATEGTKPAADEFERVVTEVKLGLPLDAALEHMLQRMPGEDLELMIVAINVQRQIGGNLSEILAVISQTIRERVRFERDLRALTAQARYSSYVITALPVALAFVINLMDAPYESFLYTTTVGYIMLGVSISMLSLGFFFLKKIATIEV